MSDSSRWSIPTISRSPIRKARQNFEQLWGTTLDPKPGLTVVEIMHAVHEGKIKGMYIMGENPAMSDPNLNHARNALASWNIWWSRTSSSRKPRGLRTWCCPASAFPEKTGTFTNTDRRVQLGRQAIDPPGDARQDLWIIQEMGRGLGLDWSYSGPAEVFAELRKAAPSIAGITWERLEKDDSVTYPCEQEGDPGEPILFHMDFRPKAVKAALFPRLTPKPPSFPTTIIPSCS